MINEIELKLSGKIKRLTNKTFKLDKRIGRGFFSSSYFLKTCEISKSIGSPKVTMQWFARTKDAMLCGIDESIALINEFAKNPQELKILALNDGDIIRPFEPVLKVNGAYENFGFLENIIDGILSRRSSVATNASRLLKAANGKEIFCMSDRQDDISNQIADGYACFIAGINKISTKALGYWQNQEPIGTMPHALIGLCGGDTLMACELYLKKFKGQITALVDYHNDVIGESLRLAKFLGEKLYAVRLDTSANLTDKFFKNNSDEKLKGVNPELVFALRKELNRNGFTNVKIVVSSGFDEDKIKAFEGVPVDIFGVGNAVILNKSCLFTGDVVNVNGRPMSKFGREEMPSTRLQEV